MLSTTLTHDQIVISPLNVRLKKHDATMLRSIGKSIMAKGLRTALEVHPMRLIDPDGPDADKFGAFCGSGRWTAIGNSIEAGELPADYEIRVDIYEGMTKGELVLASLVDNNERYNLRDFETYSAVVQAQGLGQSIEEIAQALGGREPLEILRWLRLGHLAKRVFEAFAAGQLSLDQAQAYAATDDRPLQIAAYEALKGGMPWQHKPSDIRAWMKFNDPVAERELLYVGEEAYIAAGGALQPDLFAAEGERCRRIVHPILLRRLVDTKLAELKEDLRRRVGRDVRFQAKPPENDFGTADHLLLADAREGGGDSLELPDGDIVGFVAINEVGQAEVSWWWASRAAKYGEAKPARLPGDPAARSRLSAHVPQDAMRPSPDPASDAAAIDSGAVEILRSQRRAAFRAALIDDARAGGTLARDYFIFAQLRMLIIPTSNQTNVGLAQVMIEVGPEAAREFVAAMPASRVWSDALAELSRSPILAADDLDVAWTAFLDAPQETRDLAAAMATGFALTRSLATDDYCVSLHDDVAVRAGLTDDAAFRRYWTPTEALLARLPIAQRLAIAEPLVEAAAFGPWRLLKNAALARRLLAVVTGAGEHVRQSMRDAAATWVHPLLRFAEPKVEPDWPVDDQQPDPGVNDAAPASQLEAAE